MPTPAPLTPADLPGASEALCALASRGVRQSYRKGRLLIDEGDRADTLYIVLQGRLRVFSTHAESDREITYGTYGPGEYVGEMSLDGGPRSASVETLEPTVCAVVARATLEAFVAERPAFAFELLAKVIGRARVATLTMRQLALNDAYGHLRAWLEAEAVPAADGTRWIASRPRQSDLASRIGRSPAMLSRIIRSLQDGGYLVIEGEGWRVMRALPARW